MFEDEYIWNVVQDANFDTSLRITRYHPIYLQNVVQFIFVDMLKFHCQPCQNEKNIKICFIAVRKDFSDKTNPEKEKHKDMCSSTCFLLTYVRMLFKYLFQQFRSFVFSTKFRSFRKNNFRQKIHNWLKFCLFEDEDIWNVACEADFDIFLKITQYYHLLVQNVGLYSEFYTGCSLTANLLRQNKNIKILSHRKHGKYNKELMLNISINLDNLLISYLI